jgi:hypothetical protein
MGLVWGCGYGTETGTGAETEAGQGSGNKPSHAARARLFAISVRSPQRTRAMGHSSRHAPGLLEPGALHLRMVRVRSYMSSQKCPQTARFRFIVVYRMMNQTYRFLAMPRRERMARCNEMVRTYSKAHNHRAQRYTRITFEGL